MAHGGYGCDEEVLDERGLLGQRIVWFHDAGPEHGIVRWIGHLKEMGNDTVAGVELDNPVGTNDGTWNKRRLFKTRPKHGLIISIDGLLKESEFDSETSSKENVNEYSRNERKNEDVYGKFHDYNEDFCKTNLNAEDVGRDQYQIENWNNSQVKRSSNFSGERTRKYGNLRPTQSKHQSKEATIFQETSLLLELRLALARGETEKAASLAKRLALLKINCSITLDDPVGFNAENILLNLYIEHRYSQIGPLPFQVYPHMTIGQLKMKAEEDLGIPTSWQTWIFGTKIAADDDVTLASYEIISNGCSVFLYLNKSPNIIDLYKKKMGLYFSAIEDLEVDPAIDVDVNDWNEYNLEAKKVILSKKEEAKPIGWECPMCTLINFPTRPGCSECATARPDDYILPPQYKLTPEEELRLQEEKEMDEAFKLQEEKRKQENEIQRRKNFQRILELDELGVVPNEEPFDCAVCFTEFEKGEGVTIRECLHVFCRDCLARTVEHSEGAEVKCPYTDDDYACAAIIQGREIQAVVSPEVYDRYLQKSVTEAESQAENSFHCKTPDCRGWCIYEDEVNEFDCPICKHKNCVTCQAIHENLTCKEYQDKIELDSRTKEEARKTKAHMEEMLANGEALRCPKCQIVIMKKSGCDWMQCTMCKTELCWATKGPRWGPAGNGDVTGGCHCREKGGPACHPNCHGCH